MSRAKFGFQRDEAGRIVFRLDTKTAKNIARLEATDSDDFRVLAKAAGLDPTKDFIGRDLSGIPIGVGKPNLSGFNFTKADLRGTGLKGAKLDPSVILIGAKLDRSDRVYALKANARFKLETALEKERRILTNETLYFPRNPGPWYALGRFELAHGSFEEAKKNFISGQKAAEPFEKEYETANGLRQAGESYLASDQYSIAINFFLSAINIAEILLKADPYNTDWRICLLISYSRIGDILTVQGHYSNAEAKFDTVSKIAKAMSLINGHNRDSLIEMLIPCIKIVNISLFRGDLTKAFVILETGISILVALATFENEKTKLQYNTSFLHNGISEDDVGPLLTILQQVLITVEKRSVINGRLLHHNISIQKELESILNTLNKVKS
jgi:tetratricopeptide (TPR) repeat protein